MLNINRNVKNNIERFPEYYCFQLTEEEYEFLRCKFFTLKNNGRGQHRKYLSFVFTEYGITMLAGILKTAQNKFLIIDNYTDDTILKMLQK